MAHALPEPPRTPPVAGANSPVTDHMTPSVISVTDQTPLEDVLKTLLSLDVSCALVVTAKDEPCGVISISDLARVAKFAEGTLGPLTIVPPKLVAEDVMSTNIVTVDIDATVHAAARRMLEHRIHRVFVKKGSRIVGVFSTRDALRVVLARRVDRPLRSVMSAPPVTISLGDSIADAIAKLDDRDVRGLVVVDDNHPIGIFTQLEAMRGRALPEELKANPVEEIMSYEAVALDAETPVYRAAGQAIANRTRRIMVVSGRELVGVVTGYDLAQVLA